METELEENEDMDTTLNQEGENAQETVTVLVTNIIESLQEESRQEENVPLNSKLAKAVDKVLTNKVIVKQLDALRTKIKVNKTSTDVQLYRTTICSVKLQLEENNEQLQRKIKEYEQSYYIKHSCLPLRTEQEYSELQKKRSYIQKLLRTSDFLI